jgi:hypothetical protein
VRHSKPVLLFLLCLLSACRSGDDRGLGSPSPIAPGVALYHIFDQSLLDPAGPIGVQVLRIDPQRVRLRSALAQGKIVGTETVSAMAERHGAIAAINAGFFAPNGDPLGLLQVDGELVSDTARPRGAIAVDVDANGRTRLLFDVVTAQARLVLDDGQDVPIAGVDTVRHRGKLMLFTPKYHEHTDTAANGIEWVIAGSPPAVRERRVDAGSTPIPADGFVLSFGGLEPPPPLDRLDVGARVRIERRFATRHGTPPSAWADSDHLIGGAGLLVRDGQPVAEWAIEDLRPGFTTERHPRTIVGTDSTGDLWLVTIDGRNAQLSVGMTFAELQRLARRLKLVNALNLDGGGSTTMVVRGAVVNHPSDPTGPRKVSDALLVLAR